MQTKQGGIRRKSAQTPLAFYLNTLLSVFITCLLLAVSLAPLLALFVFEKGSSWQYLALLSPLLWIFVLLPQRFSFAQAVTDRYHHKPFSLKTAFGSAFYGEKTTEGLLYALHIIKWMIPLAAALGVLYYFYMETEVFALIKGLTDFGTAMSALWNGFLNFFAGIFGGSVEALPGGIAEGIIAVAAILGLCLLFLVWGIVRNSAYRYLWAEATGLDKNPRKEAQRSLRGRRLKQLGIALINLALLAPAIGLLYYFIQPKQAVDELAIQAADAITAGTVPAIAIPYGKLAIVFFACYLPLVPLRRMITAHFATARIRQQQQAADKASANPAAQESAPMLYEDKPAGTAGKNS